MKRNTISNETIRFLNLITAIRSMPSVPVLDALEEKVLIALASKWASGIAITVMEMLDYFTDVSPSTVHRRLKTLKKKGLIALKEDDDDNRTKYIQPTQLAFNVLDEVGKCMTAAVKMK